MIDNMLGKIVTGIFLAMLFVCLAVFGAFISAVLVYFMWNHLAPLYFTGILPPQFIHLPFLHCWMFLFLFAVVFGNKASASSRK